MASSSDRTSKSYSLPNDLIAELEKEAEARVVAPAKLVENAVRAYLPTLPKLDGLEAPAAAPGVDDDPRR